MYFTKTEPINGRSKHRYWDFIVQEIYKYNKEKRICEIKEFPEEPVDFEIPENKENKLFLHFTLQKMNTDLQNVTKSLALNQRAAKSRVGYAGLKDKRGVTSQRISFLNPDIDRLKEFKRKMYFIDNFEWEEDKNDIGDLIGNQFTITTRNIQKTKEELEKILKKFEKEINIGIPNQFGMQRFGGIRNITHRVGKLILEGNTKDAVMLYLTETADREKEETKEARELIKQGEYNKAMKKFGRDSRYERAILNKLIKDPNDYVGAWLQLPKGITYLFPHAYQSYLFNKYLEKRHEKYKEKMFEKIDGDILDENGNIMGPLFGHESELAKGEAGKLEKEIMKKEKIDLKLFKVENFPQMSVKGERRNIKMGIINFKVLEIEEDEFNEGKRTLKISFELNKGQYATVVMDELMKGETYD
jgi:tRNA pseudouridine13 synthase